MSERHAGKLGPIETGEGPTPADVQRHPYQFCWYCGVEVFPAGKQADISGNTRTIDHVVPLSQGGRKHAPNAVVACRRCNQEKDDQALSEFRESRGGVVFWGEKFCPRPVTGTSLHPNNLKPFRRWLRDGAPRARRSERNEVTTSPDSNPDG